MFFIRHPKPLLSTRAVAMQVVQRKTQAERNLHVIVVDKPAVSPAAPVARQQDAADF